MLTKTIAVEPLTSIDQLKPLAQSEGPCMSIYVSSLSVGYSPSLFYTQLQAALDAAAEQFKSQYPEQDPLSLPLATVSQAIAQDYAERRRGSFAVFLSPSAAQVLWMASPVADQIRIGDVFYIRPLIAVLATIREFCILALSQKSVRFLRCANGEPHAIDLRQELPHSLEQALAMDEPDHSLENRSAAGSAEGSRHGIRFGTNTADKKPESYLTRFFKIIDDEVNRLLRAAQLPVVLCAVDEEAALYRRINTYPHLLSEGIHGSPDWLTDTQIHEQALAALARQHARDTESAAAAFTQKTSGVLLLKDSQAILEAASAGKVRAVLLADQPADQPQDAWEDEILNQIAVQTIQNGGQVFSQPVSHLPSRTAALAILRHNP